MPNILVRKVRGIKPTEEITESLILTAIHHLGGLKSDYCLYYHNFSKNDFHNSSIDVEIEASSDKLGDRISSSEELSKNIIAFLKNKYPSHTISCWVKILPNTYFIST